MTNVSQKDLRFDVASTVGRFKSMSEDRGFRKNQESDEREGQANDQRREAITRLRESGYSALNRLECDSRNGVLVLHGKVPSYYLKQLAQTFVRQIEGISVIVNNVQVTKG